MSAISLRKGLLLAAGALALQGGALLFLVQPPVCACGYIKLWEGDVLSAGNSQHLTDWYSFTHVLHGALFYLLTWLAFPALPAGGRLLIAVGPEAVWEIAENTPLVIQLYRSQALAQGYSGDSVLNSISDTLMMAPGFLLAWRLPLWSVVALAATTEIALDLEIRDNLTLNLLNFIHPFEIITRWRNGGS